MPRKSYSGVETLPLANATAIYVGVNSQMYQSWRNWCWQLGIATSLAVCGEITFSNQPILAQSTVDSTLGAENSVVTGNVDINGVSSDRIDGGARRGVNLFHSFREFNIDEGRGVYFTNPAGVENILSRVTGGKSSEILGRLGVLGNANLFLINPNGIIFGANASLDVSGSFVASTASSLKFADETQFSATKPQAAPLLTVNVPIGLQVGENAGNIHVQGNGQGIRLNSEPIDTTVGLRVQPNQTLALVGGNLTLEGGTLKTAGGRIELGSVVGSGLVNLNNTDKGFALGYEGVAAFGDIRLSDMAVVDASGLGGGDIQVIGRQVTLQDGSQIEVSTLGAESGGMLTVKASDFIELKGRALNGQVSTGLFAKAYSGTTGMAGNLSIATKKLAILDGAVISSGTFRNSKGQGGNISVTADTVELKGISPDGRFGSRLFTQTQGTGDAGGLTLNTKNLTVQDGATVSTSTYSLGKGGNLSVTADSVELKGASPDGRVASGLYAQTEGAGNAGDLTIATKQMAIKNGAVVSSGTFGSGKGGELRVKADNFIHLSGADSYGYSSGIFANTAANSTGAGGTLNIATGELTIGDEARVSVSSQGAGDAGGIDVSAGSIRLEDRGAIAATTNSGRGGNINLQTQDLLTIRRNSEISTNAVEFGNGGNININTKVLTATENSNVTANAIAGAGGNVRITTQGLFLTPDSIISASSERGIDGLVEINRPNIDPNAELVILPTQIVDVSELIAQGCSAQGNRVANEESQFLITGRGGLPPTPQEALNSDDIVEDWGNFDLSAATQQISRGDRRKNSSDSEFAVLVEAQSWQIGDRGEVLLTANATDAYYSPERNSTGCHGN